MNTPWSWGYFPPSSSSHRPRRIKRFSDPPLKFIDHIFFLLLLRYSAIHGGGIIIFNSIKNRECGVKSGRVRDAIGASTRAEAISCKFEVPSVLPSGSCPIKSSSPKICSLGTGLLLVLPWIPSMKGAGAWVQPKEAKLALRCPKGAPWPSIPRLALGGCTHFARDGTCAVQHARLWRGSNCAKGGLVHP